MAKKSSRTRRRPAPSTFAPSAPAAPAAQPQAIAATADALRRPASAPAPAAPKKPVDFATEYRYVVGDLRKMAIIAAAFFVALIVLSFVIH